MPADRDLASGMATGGRVLHHLKAALPDPRNTVLFVGYQADGTRGRRLVDGERAVKIHGRVCPVHCRIELHRIDVGARRLERDLAMAAADSRAAEDDLPRARRAAGDGCAGRDAFSELGWTTKMPQHLETVTLVDAG